MAWMTPFGRSPVLVLVLVVLALQAGGSRHGLATGLAKPRVPVLVWPQEVAKPWHCFAHWPECSEALVPPRGTLVVACRGCQGTNSPFALWRSVSKVLMPPKPDRRSAWQKKSCCRHIVSRLLPHICCQAMLRNCWRELHCLHLSTHSRGTALATASGMLLRC